LLGTAGYTAWESYQATGNPFNGQIWGAGAEGVAYVGPRVIVNAVCDTAVSTVTLGVVDRLELWPVPPEYRDAYEWGYAGARPAWELGAAILTWKLPVKTRPYVLYWDAGQNGVLVGRGLVDMPQVTRHGGGTPRLDWSQGMLWHGPTLHNSIDLGAGLLGLGGNTILLRPRPGVPQVTPVAEVGQGVANWLGPGARVLRDDAGGFVIISQDRLRKFRIDFRGPGTPPAHGHFEVWDARIGDWIDAIPGRHRFPFAE
jgi:hypothetical protein